MRTGCPARGGLDVTILGELRAWACSVRACDGRRRHQRPRQRLGGGTLGSTAHHEDHKLVVIEHVCREPPYSELATVLSARDIDEIQLTDPVDLPIFAELNTMLGRRASAAIVLNLPMRNLGGSPTGIEPATFSRATIRMNSNWNSALLSQKVDICRGFMDHSRFVAYRGILPDIAPIAATTAATPWARGSPRLPLLRTRAG